MLTLHLTLDEAILLRDALMLQRQTSQPESRPDIEKLLEAVNLYLTIQLRGLENVSG